jgi:alpha-beta hydrolase superfamily lysophospholipase/flagellar basal body-associated protein FliL
MLAVDRSMDKRERRGSRVWRILVILLIILLVLLLIILGAASWYFSDQVLRFSHYVSEAPGRVISATDKTVTLQRDGASMENGLYGIHWSGGSAVVGAIVSDDASTVIRQLVSTTGALTPNLAVKINNDVYSGNPQSDRQIAYTNVTVPSQDGGLPAWFIDGKKDTWVIMVHGLSATRTTGLRIMPVFVQQGLPVLDISYHGDVGAPANADGLSHLGASEWQDVQSAVQYAMTHGARHFILYGWSLGGSIVETFMVRSALAQNVRAVILDAPVLNWQSLLEYQAGRRNLPLLLASTTAFVAGVRIGASLSQLDYLHSSSSRLDVPTLLFHGTSDTTTPIAVSDAFAAEHQHTVTYYRFSGAEHVMSWNVNPQAYNSDVSNFIKPFVV